MACEDMCVEGKGVAETHWIHSDGIARHRMQ